MSRRERVIEAEVNQWSLEKQLEFHRIVANGNTHEFALMAVSRQAAVMGNCDRTFCEAMHHDMTRERSPKVVRGMQENARRAGINTNGKYYCGFLGQYDDPMAWVTSREDAVAACKAKGVSTDGILKVKNRSVEQAPKKRFLADDLVEEQVNRILKTEPETRERVKRGKIRKKELRERVVAEHGPPV